MKERTFKVPIVRDAAQAGETAFAVPKKRERVGGDKVLPSSYSDNGAWFSISESPEQPANFHRKNGRRRSSIAINPLTEHYSGRPIGRNEQRVSVQGEDYVEERTSSSFQIT